jgi:hypothetical protein
MMPNGEPRAICVLGGHAETGLGLLGMSLEDRVYIRLAIWYADLNKSLI